MTGGKLGMDPEQVRAKKATISAQLALIDDIADQINLAKQQGANPEAWGFGEGDKVLAPGALGSIGTAYTRLTNARAAAETLLGELTAEISDQESASGVTAGPGGVGTPGAPTDTGAGDGADPESGSGATTTTTTTRLGQGNSETEVDSGTYLAEEGFDGPMKDEKKGDGEYTVGVETTTQYGDGESTTTETVDGAETTTTTNENFVGLTTTGGVEQKITDDKVTWGADASVELGASASTSTSYTNEDLGIEAEASAEASASLKAEAAAAVGQDEDGNLVATASAGASAMAVASASASAGVGPATVSGTATAQAGARAEAEATATIGPDGVGVDAGFDAFVGGEVSLEGSAEVMGVEAGATVTGYAGAGIKADVEAKITAEEVKISVDLGVALGIGGGVSFDIGFSPAEMASDIGGFFGF